MPRVKKNIKSDFTTVHNSYLRDVDLDLKERGLLTTMLSLPNDWNFTIKGLTAILPNGYESIMNSLNRLEEHGYLKRTVIREKNRIKDTLYEFSDEKLYEKKKNKINEISEESAFPIIEEQLIEKYEQLNTIESKTIQSNSIYNNNKDINISRNKQNKVYRDKTKETNKCTDIIFKGSDVVEKESRYIKFDVERFVSSSKVKESILRSNEARYSDVLSKKTIKFVSDKCNCFGYKNIDIINNFTDDEYVEIYELAQDLIDDEVNMYKDIDNKDGLLVNTIKKRIAIHLENA